MFPLSYLFKNMFERVLTDQVDKCLLYLYLDAVRSANRSCLKTLLATKSRLVLCHLQADPTPICSCAITARWAGLIVNMMVYAERQSL